MNDDSSNSLPMEDTPIAVATGDDPVDTGQMILESERIDWLTWAHLLKIDDENFWKKLVDIIYPSGADGGLLDIATGQDVVFDYLCQYSRRYGLPPTMTEKGHQQLAVVTKVWGTIGGTAPVFTRVPQSPLQVRYLDPRNRLPVQNPVELRSYFAGQLNSNIDANGTPIEAERDPVSMNDHRYSAGAPIGVEMDSAAINNGQCEEPMIQQQAWSRCPAPDRIEQRLDNMQQQLMEFQLRIQDQLLSWMGSFRDIGPQPAVQMGYTVIPGTETLRQQSHHCVNGRVPIPPLSEQNLTTNGRISIPPLSVHNPVPADQGTYPEVRQIGQSLSTAMNGPSQCNNAVESRHCAVSRVDQRPGMERSFADSTIGGTQVRGKTPKLMMKPFSGTTSDQKLSTWLIQYQARMEATGYSLDADLIRYLPMYLTGDALEWYTEFVKQRNVQQLQWRDVVKAISDQYEVGDANLRFKQFHSYRPVPGQSIIDYANQLERLWNSAVPNATPEERNRHLVQAFLANMDQAMADRLQERFMMTTDFPKFDDLRTCAAKYELMDKEKATNDLVKSPIVVCGMDKNAATVSMINASKPPMPLRPTDQSPVMGPGAYGYQGTPMMFPPQRMDYGRPQRQNFYPPRHQRPFTPLSGYQQRPWDAYYSPRQQSHDQWYQSQSPHSQRLSSQYEYQPNGYQQNYGYQGQQQWTNSYQGFPSPHFGQAPPLRGQAPPLRGQNPPLSVMQQPARQGVEYSSPDPVTGMIYDSLDPPQWRPEYGNAICTKCGHRGHVPAFCEFSTPCDVPGCQHMFGHHGRRCPLLRQHDQEALYHQQETIPKPLEGEEGPHYSNSQCDHQQPMPVTENAPVFLGQQSAALDTCHAKNYAQSGLDSRMATSGLNDHYAH